jgi:succinoglycan biosynthesis transport protein ExoP
MNHSLRGIVSVLSGTCTLSEAMKSSGVKGLGFLSRGPDVSNPSEVLNSVGFSKLVEYLSGKFDRIIIDSPPVTSVTDAQILSAICDITILVLRAEKSTRKTSLQARQSLVNVGAHILGAVVNDAPKTDQYGYYSRYGYYYGDHNNDKNLKKVEAM